MAVYNSQLVTQLFSAINRLNYSADYGSEDAFELYHRIQEHNLRSQGHSNDGIGLPALGHALAGSAGTAVSHLLLYPLDLAITRLQVQQQLKSPGEAPSAAKEADDAEYTSLADAAQKIYKHEGGLQAFWNGCATDTAKGIIDSFLFFLAYTALRQRQQRKLGTRSLPVFHELSVGIVAGAFSKLITTPIQQIVTRKQTAALVAARDTTSSYLPGNAYRLSIKDIFLQIRSERGLGGFWAGYSASLILTLNPALTFLLQNLFKQLLPRSQRDKPGPRLLFLMAAVSKAAASTVTYPFSLAKSRAQVSRPMAEETQREKPSYLEKPDLSSKTRAERLARKGLRIIFWQNLAHLAIIRSLRNIYASEGVRGLYSGLDAEVAKGFLGHGLSMVLKERIHVLIISAYYMMLKGFKKFPEELGSVSEQARREIEKVKDAAVNVAEDAVEGAKDMATGARDMAGGTVDSARGMASGAIEGVRGVLGGSVENAKTMATDASEGARNMTTGAFESVKGMTNGSMENVRDMATNTYEGAQSMANQAIQSARNMTSGSYESAKAATSGSYESAKEVASSAHENAQGMTNTALEQAKNMTNGSVESARNLTAGSAESARNLTNGSVEGAKDMMNTSVEVGKDVGERVQNVGETVVEGVKSAVKNEE